MTWLKRLSPLLLCIAVLPAAADAQAIKSREINHVSTPDQSSRATAAKVQILLDRHGFSPGVIDGRMGENVENTLAAFRKENGIDAKDQQLDDKTWSKLSEGAPDEVIVDYTIAEDDVKGPFTKNISEDFEKQRELDRLGYRDPAELLAEKFHMDEDFLKELNPDKEFGKARTIIQVANLKQESEDDKSKVKRVEVHKSHKQVRAYGDNDKLLAVYPATIGSEEKPAPSGTLKVKGVAKDPKYTYDPEYDFKGVDSDKAFTIAPGPNNPVGAVWIDLSKEGYGIHGTAEPAEIGKAASHGCIRLTNWDALDLAERVENGVKVEFLGSSD
jgi:lipoprotein-anchoring transpeptidase ErfK/SrfK